jgi:hypothetical protein
MVKFEDLFYIFGILTRLPTQIKPSQQTLSKDSSIVGSSISKNVIMCLEIQLKLQKFDLEQK